MELIESEDDSQANGDRRATAPLLREAKTPAERENGQTLLQLILWGLAAIVLVVLIVLFARWVYHATHHKAAPAPTNTRLPLQTSNQPSQSGQTSKTSGNSGSASTATPNSQLPNGGPGDVAAIFAVSSLAAAGLHYIISVRRLSKADI